MRLITGVGRAGGGVGDGLVDAATAGVVGSATGEVVMW